MRGGVAMGRTYQGLHVVWGVQGGLPGGDKGPQETEQLMRDRGGGFEVHLGAEANIAGQGGFGAGWRATVRAPGLSLKTAQ